MKTIRRGLVAGVSAAILLASVSATSAAELVRVAKSQANNFVFALVNVGEKQGIFEKHGIDIEIIDFAGSAKAVQGMTVGAADIGLSAGAEMSFGPKGSPIRAVALAESRPDQVLVVDADGAIKAAEDLKGGNFAVSSFTAVSAWFARKFAEQMGWGADGITLQVVASSQAALALIENGEIQAMSQNLPTALNGEKVGNLKIIYDFAENVPEFVQYAVYATTNMIEQRPEVLRNFVAAWLETVAYVKANKDESVAIISEAIGFEPDIVGQVYDRISSHLSDDGRFDPKAIDVMKQSYIDMELLTELPDSELMYTEAFLPAKQ